jgi:malate synthase
MRDREAADFQAELHEDLLAQKASLEQQQQQQQAQLDKEKAVVS